jgi:hypothetical protein
MSQDGASAPTFRVGEQDGASALHTVPQTASTHLNSPRPYARGIEHPLSGRTRRLATRRERQEEKKGNSYEHT